MVDKPLMSTSIILVWNVSIVKNTENSSCVKKTQLCIACWIFFIYFVLANNFAPHPDEVYMKYSSLLTNKNAKPHKDIHPCRDGSTPGQETTPKRP